MAEIEIRRSPADLASAENPAAVGHNHGPPLDDEHQPEWGHGGIGNYFYWKAAHRAAWKNPSPGIVAFRIKKAERLGLTYEEHTLEILERGHHLQTENVERTVESHRRFGFFVGEFFDLDHDAPEMALEPARNSAERALRQLLDLGERWRQTIRHGIIPVN